MTNLADKEMATADKDSVEAKHMYHVNVEGAADPDAGDMYRMGKTQEFRRIFRQSTMIMFTSMVQSTWEVLLIAPIFGLVNGGLAGLFWSYVWTFVGFCTIVASLAEMASMAPTNGGQYHWVSEFAPRKYQRFLSYISGWLALLSWQAGAASGCYIIGNIIQAVIVAYNPTTYVAARWQGTLFAIAIALVQAIVNAFFASQLPRMQKFLVIPHALGWIAVVIVLWVMAPHASAKDVFTNFSSNGGWEPIGLSLMVGQITPATALILSDSAAHLAEEVKTAARSVPLSILWSFFLNALVAFIVLVTFLFAIPDVTAVLDPATNPSGSVFLYVFLQASYRGSIPLTTLMLMVFLGSAIDCAASTSRQFFAFARDGGTPFKAWVSKVHNEEVPRNAVLVTCIISILLSLVNLGSTIAFNAIISLQLLALMLTYCISIGCVLYRRVTPGYKLPQAQWSLGRYGIWINAFGFAYSFFVLFWAGWPVAKEVTAVTFNWAPVMFAAVLIFSLSYYFLWGRRTYEGPVVLVRNVDD